MFPQHATLHASIAGYQDTVRFFDSGAAGTAAARLELCGWAFHWREAARPVRYVRREDNNNNNYHHQVLTPRDRPDVADAYSRVAVRMCGWSETIELPAATDPEDCPEQWLEMQLRSGEWVKFRDLVTYHDEDDEDNNEEEEEEASPAVVVVGDSAVPVPGAVETTHEAEREMSALLARFDALEARLAALEAGLRAEEEAATDNKL